MNESRQIALLFAITLAVGALGLYFVWQVPRMGGPDGASIDTYRATIYPDGLIRETFTYTFTTQKYRMMYRGWDASVSTTPLYTAHIQPISIEAPANMIPYIKDRYGEVTLPEGGAGSRYISVIEYLAEYNEVGCFDPGYIKPGTYTVSFTSLIYPPPETDTGVVHLNLMLGSVHIPYNSVQITIEDAAYVQAIYAHPPSLTVKKSGNTIVVEGYSGNDELLELEFLMNPTLSRWKGVERQVTDVKAKTEDANRLYSLQYTSALWLSYGVSAVTVASPFLIFALWYLGGRE